MFTLHLRIPFRGGDAKCGTDALERKHEPHVRAYLDSIGVHPVAAIRYTRDGLGTHATCTVLAYPERSAA